MIKFEVYVDLNEESDEYFDENVFSRDLMKIIDSEGVIKLSYCYVTKMVDLND